MSFSNPKLSNPCRKFIEFKGDKGVFQYWDKEKEENVILKLPCYFVILDELTTIKGYNDRLQCGLYSNEIHDLTTEQLRIKSFKGGLTITGLYNDIKGEMKSEGGKYCKSVYAMLIDGSGNREFVNFQLTGSAFSAYLDKKFKQDRDVVCITGAMTEKEKGITKYKEPVFKAYKMDAKYIPEATEMDLKLQNYLKQYKKEAISEVQEKEEKIDFVNEQMEYAANKEAEREFNQADDASDLPF